MINQTVNNRLHYLGGGIQVMQHLPVTVATSDWWNPGGTFTCVAAYQAKGAASQAASYVNLANPGTYDAAPGVAPTWASGTGWTFNGIDQYLTTSVSMSNTWSIIIRYTGGTFIHNSVLAGASNADGTKRIVFQLRDTLAYRMFNGGFYLGANGSYVTDATLCIAGQSSYKNGVAYGAIPAGTAGDIGAVTFVGANNLATAPVNFSAFTAVGIAIYSTTLDATQVATLTTNMNSL